MTFPVAFNLYWLVTSGTQLVVLNAFRNQWIREYYGLEKFLPGSKLERLNVMTASQRRVIVNKPKILKSKPKIEQNLEIKGA